MRSLSRLRQKVWFSRRSERLVNTVKIPVYEKPIMILLTVSSQSGTPEEISSGLILNYDRYITYYKPRLPTKVEFQPEEGMVLWVDREPQLDDDGNVSLTENGEAIVPPDYVLKKILDSQKSLVARFGISKIQGA